MQTQSVVDKVLAVKCKGSDVMSLDDIYPFQGNFKELTKENYDKLKHTITTEGFCDPINVWLDPEDGKHKTLDGHQRGFVLRGLQSEGWFIPKLPVNFVYAKDKEEAKKLILTFSSNYGKISEESLSDFMIDSGLTADFLETSVVLPEVDLDYFNEGDPAEGLTDPDEVPEVRPEQTRVAVGDIWTLGNHRLMCGDSTSIEAVEKLMNGAKADFVYMDPPYGMNLDTDYAKTNLVKGKTYKPVMGDDKDFDPRFFFEYFSEAREHFWWGADYYCQFIPRGGSWVVWDKKKENLDESIGTGFELCWSRSPHKRMIARFLWSGFTAKERNETRVHPTQKPIALNEWFFKHWGKTTDNVVDLFGGSGSTLIACEKTNRKCFMMELDPHYVNVILERWEKFTGKTAELSHRDL